MMRLHLDLPTTDLDSLLHTRYMRHLQMFQKVEYGGGPIFKVVLECLKGVLNLFLSISMAFNVMTCRKVAENTQNLKIAKFAM